MFVLTLVSHVTHLQGSIKTHSTVYYKNTPFFSSRVKKVVCVELLFDLCCV